MEAYLVGINADHLVFPGRSRCVLRRKTVYFCCCLAAHVRVSLIIPTMAVASAWSADF